MLESTDIAVLRKIQALRRLLGVVLAGIVASHGTAMFLLSNEPAVQPEQTGGQGGSLTSTISPYMVYQLVIILGAVICAYFVAGLLNSRAGRATLKMYALLLYGVAVTAMNALTLVAPEYAGASRAFTICLSLNLGAGTCCVMLSCLLLVALFEKLVILDSSGSVLGHSLWRTIATQLADSDRAVRAGSSQYRAGTPQRSPDACIALGPKPASTASPLFHCSAAGSAPGVGLDLDDVSSGRSTSPLQQQARAGSSDELQSSPQQRSGEDNELCKTADQLAVDDAKAGLDVPTSHRSHASSMRASSAWAVGSPAHRAARVAPASNGTGRSQLGMRAIGQSVAYMASAPGGQVSSAGQLTQRSVHPVIQATWEYDEGAAKSADGLDVALQHLDHSLARGQASRLELARSTMQVLGYLAPAFNASNDVSLHAAVSKSARTVQAFFLNASAAMLPATGHARRQVAPAPATLCERIMGMPHMPARVTSGELLPVPDSSWANEAAGEAGSKLRKAGGPTVALPDGTQLDVQRAAASLLTVETFRSFGGARSALHARLRRGRDVLAALAVGITALFVLATVVQFGESLTYVSPLFTASQLAALNKPAGAAAHFGTAAGPQFRNHTVLMVILDGTRADMLEKNPALSTLVQDPAYARDSWVTTMDAALPSMSVPNWVTLLVGAPPEVHGTMGNLFIPETGLDSIFRQVRLYSPSRAAGRMFTEAGVTASPWMADIVRSQLPFLRGDGTVSTTVSSSGDDEGGAAMLTSADGADHVRGQVAVSALSNLASPYHFFLAHFSDVDVQGHAFGVTPEYNKRNTYHGALANKTAIVRSLLHAMNASAAASGRQFTMVVVSDHGHVDAGGHGGVQPELIHVPLMVWSPGSGLQERVREWNALDQSSPAQTSNAAPVLAAGQAVLATDSRAAGNANSGWYRGFRAHQRSQGSAKRIRNYDVTASIAALLGVPLPRSCFGEPIDEIMMLLADTPRPNPAGGIPAAGGSVLPASNQYVAETTARVYVDVYWQRLDLATHYAEALDATAAWQAFLAAEVRLSGNASVQVACGAIPAAQHACATGSGSSVSQCQVNSELAQVCIDAAVAGATRVEDFMEDARQRALVWRSTRNLLLMCVIMGCASLLLHLMQQRFTVMDPAGVVRLVLCSWHGRYVRAVVQGEQVGVCGRCCASCCVPCFGGYTRKDMVLQRVLQGGRAARGSSGRAAPASETEPDWSALHHILRWGLRVNWQAAAWAMCITYMYWLFCLILFAVVYNSVGYSGLWDSTLVHSPAAMQRFMLVSLLPALLLTWLIFRVFRVFGSGYARLNFAADTSTVSSSPDTHAARLTAVSAASSPVVAVAQCCARTWCTTRACIRGGDVMVSDFTDLVNVVKYYTLWFSLSTQLVLLLLGSLFAFPIPGVLPVKLISEFLWLWRFRCITVQIMAAPLTIGSMFSVLLSPHNVSMARLAVSKQLRLLQDIALREAVWAKAKGASSPRAPSKPCCRRCRPAAAALQQAQQSLAYLIDAQGAAPVVMRELSPATLILARLVEPGREDLYALFSRLGSTDALLDVLVQFHGAADLPAAQQRSQRPAAQADTHPAGSAPLV